TVYPSVTVSAPSGVLCSNTTITFTATPTHPGTAPGYAWRKNGASVATFGPSYITNSLVKGDSIEVTMTSNAECAANPIAVSNTLFPNIINAVTPGISIN